MSIGLNQNPNLKYCLHYPENNADQIKLSIGKNNIKQGNVYSSTKVNVELKSKGSLIASGVDANQNISVTISGASQCNVTLNHLLNGKGLVTLSFCGKGTVELLVKIMTHRGTELETNITIQLNEVFNVVLFAPPSLNEHVTDKLTRGTGNAEMRLLQDDGLFYLETGQSHMFFYIETSSNDVIFDQYTQAKGTPSIVFNMKHQKLEGFNSSMVLSLPPNSNFYTALLDEQVHNKSQVVLIRTKDSMSYRDLYAVHRLDINLYKDIVVPSSPNSKTLNDELKGIPSDTVIIMFLDSYRASIVLRQAIGLQLTPDRDYLWISVSSRFVISNSFMRDACLSYYPQCHVAFNEMWNVFHTDDLLDCPKSPEAYSVLVSPITDLTDTMQRILTPVIVEEVRIVLDRMILEMSSLNRSFDHGFFSNYTGNIDCLPLGSGLVFKSKLEYVQENFTLTSIMCQPGWTGATCSTPYCSSVSCNQTNGKCIAPEVCHCNVGQFGRNCNGNCKRTCVNGACNDGMFGDGTCSSCDWLYVGVYCDEKTIIYGFVAASIGTTVCGVFLMLYVVRLIQTQEQNAVAEIEAAEVDYSMTWDDMETSEDVDYTTKVVRRQLEHKLQYTRYKRGRTFAGRSVFVKCIEKPQFQITLGIKNELQQICQLSHNNIEQLLGIILSETVIGVVTPAANMGSLYDVLHEKNIFITWDVRYSMMQDVCRGMTYLHDVAKIKHGRLKSTNCVIYQGNHFINTIPYTSIKTVCFYIIILSVYTLFC